ATSSHRAANGCWPARRRPSSGRRWRSAGRASRRRSWGRVSLSIPTCRPGGSACCSRPRARSRAGAGVSTAPTSVPRRRRRCGSRRPVITSSNCWTPAARYGTAWPSRCAAAPPAEPPASRAGPCCSPGGHQPVRLPVHADAAGPAQWHAGCSPFLSNMAIEVGLTHRTSYAYDRAARLGPQVIRLRPAAAAPTMVLSYGLMIEPARHFLNWQQDPYGNWLARVVIPEPATRFEVVVDLVAEMSVVNPFDFFLEPGAETWPFTYEPLLRKDLAPYLEPEPAGARLATWLRHVERTPARTVDFLVSLNQRLQRDIGYVIRMEPGIQTCEETLGLGTGSCRDSAWLLVQLLRNLGLAARFTSGYLIQLKPDVAPLDGPAGTDRDFTDLHAWAEVYLPGAGWIGLDPTSGLLAGEGHIPLACTPDPQNAAPITGEVEPCGVSFEFAMHVERIRETPRVTKPYEESVWQAILACGDAVDARLVDGDVRL